MTTENLQVDRETVLEAKKHWLQARKEQTPLPAISALASMQNRPRPILNTIPADGRAQIIGQIRRHETYDPVAQALQYIRGRVDAISLYTDHSLYNDDFDDMQMVAAAVKDLPIIYQNYVLDDYQVIEARAADASAIMLYTSVLNERTLWNVASVTQRWKMSVIVQVDNMAALESINRLSPHAIAIGDNDIDIHRGLDLLEQLRPQVGFNIRVMFLPTIETLEAAHAAIELGADAIIISPHLLENNKRKQLDEIVRR
ncbi:MAG: hypothetical protein D6712_14795 [Chloroflexi bacterium]|nr:MAG: hypothetical protein D6712_14795 [Chloroflexota bacterium]